MKTKGKIRPIVATEHSLFYCRRNNWCPKYTHYILLAALIFQKCRMDNAFFVFFNHALPNFKTRPVSPDFRNEADWLKMRRATSYKKKLLCWPADIQSVTRSPHPFSSHHYTLATTVAKRRAQGWNQQSERKRHCLADAKRYRNLYRF